MAKRKVKRKSKSRRPTAGRYHKNAAAESAEDRAIRRAVARFTNFHGDPPADIKRINLRRQDRVVLTVGEVKGIMYDTVRDGRRESYLHRFRSVKARPLLAVSSDGRQLYLIGGSYSVTARGIVDSA